MVLSGYKSTVHPISERAHKKCDFTGSFRLTYVTTHEMSWLAFLDSTVCECRCHCHYWLSLSVITVWFLMYDCPPPPVELACRSGSVMDCHATARGSIPGASLPSLGTVNRGAISNLSLRLKTKWHRCWREVKHKHDCSHVICSNVLVYWWASCNLSVRCVFTYKISYTTRFVHPTFRIQIIKIVTFRIQALLNIVYM